MSLAIQSGPSSGGVISTFVSPKLTARRPSTTPRSRAPSTMLNCSNLIIAPEYSGQAQEAVGASNKEGPGPTIGPRTMRARQSPPRDRTLGGPQGSLYGIRTGAPKDLGQAGDRWP